MDQFDYNQPNTRARIAARRRRTRVPAGESGVLPGPRRVLGQWLGSGHALSLLLLLASLGGLWYIATSPRFVVREVRVEGAQAISEADVVALSGASGRSIWLVDTAAVVARVGGSAYVERVEASLQLPDVLTIALTERRAELRWQSGGVRYLIDADGRVLGPDTTGTISNTLVIDDRSGRAFEPNDQVDPDALQLVRMLALRLPAEVGLAPASIGWDVNSGVFVTTGDGRTIVFGRGEHLDRKLRILDALINKEPTQFTYLDLRPGTPFYRNDGAAAPGDTSATP